MKIKLIRLILRKGPFWLRVATRDLDLLSPNTFTAWVEIDKLKLA
jgi:hypothetical protein